MFKLFFFVLLGSLALLTAPFIGAVDVPLATIWDTSLDLTTQEIFWNLRLPRLVLGMLAGASLAVGGIVFQALFANHLACPYTLGVSTGAALGAVLAMYFGIVSDSQTLGFFSFLGALLTIALVSYLGRKQSSAGMLLAGVAVSVFFSSLVVLLQYLSSYESLFKIVRWLMGGIEAVGWQAINSVYLPVLLGLLIIFIFVRDLDLIVLGEEFAISKGVEIEKVRKILFFATSLMVGAIVSVCGPIAFVGIMVPHICRMLFRVRHRELMILSTFAGACFLPICDSIGRTLVPPFEMPVGVMTSLLGGPFFIWLLVKKDHRKSV